MEKKKFKYGKKGFRKFVGVEDAEAFNFQRAKECLRPLYGTDFIESTADYNYGWPFSVMCKDGSLHAFIEYGAIFAWATAMAKILVGKDDGWFYSGEGTA